MSQNLTQQRNRKEEQQQTPVPNDEDIPLMSIYKVDGKYV
jgi:hypothetical protein